MIAAILIMIGLGILNAWLIFICIQMENERGKDKRQIDTKMDNRFSK